MLASLSIRSSTLPLVAFSTASTILSSVTTVPDFGFGIKPLRPKYFPSLAILGIISLVAIATSKSSHPSSICLLKLSSMTYEAPASFTLLAVSPSTKTKILISLPVPLGKSVVSLNC